MGRPVLALLLLAPSLAAQDLADDPPSPEWKEILQLRTRLDALEQKQAQADGERAPIDLSGEELPSIQPNSNHVLSRPWFQNLDLSGYAAFTYLDSGGAGSTPDGTLVVKEASLFLDARVWERVSLFTEVRLARYLFGTGFSLGELYLQFSRLLGEDRPELGLKVGRLEIPFGEDYLRWDANETPLIAFSAADPYGVDEGVQLYGDVGPVSWITALSNGGNGTGADADPGKLLVTKLYGEPFSDLYLSGSVLASWATAISAFRLSGSTITPVGAEGDSSAGTSPSDDVDTLGWEVDAHVAKTRRARLLLQLGQAYIDDDVEAFDRELTWFQVEPGFRLTSELELVLRYSGVGTYDDDEGYRFDGKIVADGESFGYDTTSLHRVAGGLRWLANPHVAVKAEVGCDRFDLIDLSPLDEENDERLYFSLELVGSF